MTVRLGAQWPTHGVNFICNSPDFALLLQSTKKNWNVLEIDMGATYDDEWRCAAYTFLFKDPLPALASLTFVGPDNLPMDLPAELHVLSAPHIRTLSWGGVFPPQFSEPPLHLQNITLARSKWSQWWALVPVLASSPLINRMAINYTYFPYPPRQFQQQSNPELTFPSLVTLEMLRFGRLHVPYSLGTMCFPRLSEIVFDDWGVEEFANILSFLVSNLRLLFV